jgi:hypothetical protein
MGVIKVASFIALVLAIGVPRQAVSADFEVTRPHAPKHVSASIRGQVVLARCSSPLHDYISCRSKPLDTAVIVTKIEVDGSVWHRQLMTDRKGRFRIKVVPKRYYVLSALPPVPGMHTEPIELTVPPEGVVTTIRVFED